MDAAHVAALFADNGSAAPTSAKIIRPNFALLSAVPPFALVGPEQGLWGPLEPLAYAVAGIIPASSLTLLSGYSSSLKSWLALHMGFAKGAGLPWLGHEPFAAERGPVSYFDREAGLHELRRRLHAIRRPLGIMDDPLLDVCSFPVGGNIFSREFMARLRELAHQRDLIVLDTLVAFAAGADENSAQMAEGLGACSESIAGTKCAMVVVAHEKKKGANGDVDPRERVRGSSAIFGAVDVVLSCQRSAPREPVEVVQTKARNGREAEPFAVSMLDAPDGGVTFAVAGKTEPRELTPTERLDLEVDRVVDVVRDNPRCSGAVVQEALRIRKASVGVLVARAIEQGRIRNLGNEKAPALVALEGTR